MPELLVQTDGQAGPSTQTAPAPRRNSLCACGNTAPVYEGVLGLHVPKTERTPDGRQRPVIRDIYGSAGCRYSLRTVTLDAAIQRDNILGPVEQRVRDVTRDQLEKGRVFAAPHGYRLPKTVANLFALADANGWATVQVWTPRGDGYVLSLRVGWADDDRRWEYDLCLIVTPDEARQTGLGWSRTPDRPHPHDTPSIKVIRKVISKNPMAKGVDPPYLGLPSFWSLEQGGPT